MLISHLNSIYLYLRTLILHINNSHLKYLMIKYNYLASFLNSYGIPHSSQSIKLIENLFLRHKDISNMKREKWNQFLYLLLTTGLPFLF
jgi:hypothetical protein